MTLSDFIEGYINKLFVFVFDCIGFSSVHGLDCIDCEYIYNEILLKHQNNGRLSRFIYNINAVIGHCHVDRTIINIK